MAKEKKRLLLIGSTQKDVHLRNYFRLIDGYFDEVLVVSGNNVDFCRTIVLDFGLKNPLTIWKSIHKLRGIIQDFQPSIIHVHQANSYGYITSKANTFNIPLVLTVWGSDVLLLPDKSPLHKLMVKTSLKASNHITADAAFIADKVETLVGRKSFTTANFGIDLPKIEWDIAQKEKIIYSNRLHAPLYNIDQIIQGFASFVQQHPDWKLIIAGKGPLTDSLEELARSTLPDSSYEFIGFVDTATNMKMYLKASMYVSIPSSDGTSVSLLEAMACGTIPVLSDLPANREWVQSGRNGIIVQSDLSAALELALDLNPENVANANTRIIQHQATKEANRLKYCEIYDSLLEGRS